MTKDHARKRAIRARMAADGESYSVAARNLRAAAGDGAADGAGAGDAVSGDAASGSAAAGEIAACAGRTLAERSARIAFRYDWDWSRMNWWAGQEPRGTLPRPVRELARRAGKAVRKRVSGGAEFSHGAAEGFLEPAVGRYVIDFGEYAEMCVGGVTFGGRSGRSLQTLRPMERRDGVVLWLLRLLLGATDARLEDDARAGDDAQLEDMQPMRGTHCRRYAVRVELAPAEAASGAALPPPTGVNSWQPPALQLIAWTDGHHIRRVQFDDRVPAVSHPQQQTTHVSQRC